MSGEEQDKKPISSSEQQPGGGQGSSGSPTPPSETPEDIRKRLAEMEKLLAKEREKAMLLDMRAKQEDAYSARVEASLKDIQQKIQRDRREREIEEERAQLREKVRELESKITSERESWVHVLRTQLQPQQQPPPAPPQPQQPVVPAPQQSQPSVQPQTGAPAETARQSEILARLEMLERKWSGEKLPPVQPEPPQPASRAEAPAEKSEMVRELSRLRENFTRLDRQNSFLSQIATVVGGLRDATAHMSRQAAQQQHQQQPAAPVFAWPPYNPYAQPLQQPQPYSQPGAQPPAQQHPPVSYTELAGLREEVRKAKELAREKTETAARAEQEKLHALNGLIRMKSMLMRMKAVNTAIEREIARLQTERKQAEEAAAEQSRQTAQLQGEIKSLAERHASDMSDVTRQLDLKIAEAAGLSAEIRQLQAEHPEKILALESLLATNAQEYERRLTQAEADHAAEKERAQQAENAAAALGTRLTALESEKTAAETELRQKLAEENAVRRELETGLAGARALLESAGDEASRLKQETVQARLESAAAALQQKTTFDMELGRLAGSLRKMKAEQAALTFRIFKAEKETRDVSAKKELLEQLTEQLRAQSQADRKLLTETQARLAELEGINAELRGELEKQRRALEQALAKSAETELELKNLLVKETAAAFELRQRLAQYENMSSTLSGRLKWSLSGKFRRPRAS
ncbi:MAG: hypothetical protein PHP45_05615 [Elusimicrobiales bacterium]|nr:hypothetical protein [Elusimicrobiales bacterium]